MEEERGRAKVKLNTKQKMGSTVLSDYHYTVARLSLYYSTASCHAHANTIEPHVK